MISVQHQFLAELKQWVSAFSFNAICIIARRRNERLKRLCILIIHLAIERIASFSWEEYTNQAAILSSGLIAPKAAPSTCGEDWQKKQ